MKNLNLLFLIMVLFLCQNAIQSQVTIGALTEPDGSALLDLKNQTDNSSTKGFLLPRVTIKDTLTFGLAGDSKTAGMLVYNTEPKSASTTNKGEGIYYWNGNVWKWINNGTLSANPNNWSLTGNSGTSPGTNFLGTTDNNALQIKTNNQPRVILLAGTGTTAGNVGIGTTTPASKLHINGDLTLVNDFKVGGTANTAGSSGSTGQILRSNGLGSSPQ